MNVFPKQMLILPKNLIYDPIPLVIIKVDEFLRARQKAEYAAVQNGSDVNAT